MVTNFALCKGICTMEVGMCTMEDGMLLILDSIICLTMVASRGRPVIPSG